jgi:tRNA threonylcarbamoyladenosine biosynthesis protein TsaB
LILAIDTTSDHGSIALANGDCVLEEVPLHSPDGFAHILFPAIQALLARHRLSIRDLDRFAAASGPGSFTGVRIGLTAAKGLAESTGRQVVAVSNLKALATVGTRALRATVIDARRGEIYGAVYDASLGLVQEEVVIPFDRWIAGLPAGEIEIVTAGFPLRDVTMPVIEAPQALAGAIARIAGSAPAHDPAEIDANYVRRSDAELLWKDPA